MEENRVYAINCFFDLIIIFIANRYPEIVLLIKIITSKCILLFIGYITHKIQVIT